ncbi:hypothetical protein LX36DRAFT_449100 [Colletotrichum falcatum]|nr:hypothetical protein LX36DRAFT_449100 [Colletotrichum falcatum]
MICDTFTTGASLAWRPPLRKTGHTNITPRSSVALRIQVCFTKTLPCHWPRLSLLITTQTTESQFQGLLAVFMVLLTMPLYTPFIGGLSGEPDRTVTLYKSSFSA